MATTTKLLTFASPTDEFTTVAGRTYVLGITFVAGMGASVKLEAALSGSNTVYGDVSPNLSEGFWEIVAPGTKLKATAIGALTGAVINLDLTDKL